MKKLFINLLPWLITALLTSALPASENGYSKVSCVIHLHSSFSRDIRYTIDDLAFKAREKNIGCMILSDHDIATVEYGLYPLRGLIKKKFIQPSVLSIGPEKYLLKIKEAGAKYPEVLIIPGIESAPFYYWSGSYFKKNLTLNNWNKHLLVLGMSDPEDYKNLPLVSNPGSGRFSPLLLWPVLLLLAPLFFKRFRLFFIVFSAALIYNNFPFMEYAFDQYNGPQGDKPYQALIDYANAKNALTYWAHPEAPNYNESKNLGPVFIKTEMYPDALTANKDYTGFSMFFEGYRNSGSIGGQWDTALKEYISGARARPVWAIGELDYQKTADAIDTVRNFIYVKDKKQENIIEALRNGNSYVLVKGSGYSLSLDKCEFKSGAESALPGQELSYSKPVRLDISASASDSKPHKLKISIIKNGALENIIESTTPFNIKWEDPRPVTAKTYYRVYIEENYSNKIAVNPVFVIPADEKEPG